jgi:hypothetical protein
LNRFRFCETIVEKGLQTFVLVGLALAEIRASKLYRQDYETFEEYCRDRWQMIGSRARQLINAAKVVGNLQSQSDTKGNGSLPASERVARTLAKLEPEQQREAWRLALSQSPAPTAVQVEQIIKSLLNREDDDDDDNDSPSKNKAFVQQIRHHPVFDIDLRDQSEEVSSEDFEGHILRQQFQNTVDRLKATIWRWFDELPSLEAQRRGVEKVRALSAAFRKEFIGSGSKPTHSPKSRTTQQSPVMEWYVSHQSDSRIKPLADRHYYRKNPQSVQFAPPGRCVVLRTANNDAFWITQAPYAQYTRHQWAGAWTCSAFRNESTTLSSRLITQAVAVSLFILKTPPELGFITFVNPTKIKSTNPGCCFKKAGWKLVGLTKGGLYALQLLPGAFPEPVAPCKENHTESDPYGTISGSSLALALATAKQSASDMVA